MGPFFLLMCMFCRLMQMLTFWDHPFYHFDKIIYMIDHSLANGSITRAYGMYHVNDLLAKSIILNTARTLACFKVIH